MSNIEIKNLSKSFGEKKVLDRFSASLPSGGITVIMGESGCGKTTLINILMGFEKADEGTVEGLPSSVSAVFQDDCLCEDFTSISNLRAVVGRKRPRNELEDLLVSMGLTREDISRPVRQLSGGMKRRVAIARALAADGELLIMDEPFKGLDEEMRKKVIAAVLNDTRSKNRTLIVITHDPDEIGLLCADHTIIMK